jgi:hypothetical protein
MKAKVIARHQITELALVIPAWKEREISSASCWAPTGRCPNERIARRAK